MYFIHALRLHEHAPFGNYCLSYSALDLEDIDFLALSCDWSGREHWRIWMMTLFDLEYKKAI